MIAQLHSVPFVVSYLSREDFCGANFFSYSSTHHHFVGSLNPLKHGSWLLLIRLALAWVNLLMGWKHQHHSLNSTIHLYCGSLVLNVHRKLLNKTGFRCLKVSDMLSLKRHETSCCEHVCIQNNFSLITARREDINVHKRTPFEGERVLMVFGNEIIPMPF